MWLLLRGACFQRFARRIASEYEIRTVHTTLRLGLPAFISSQISVGNGRYANSSIRPRRLIYRDTMARRAYLKIAAAMEGLRAGCARDDLVIGQFHWTAKVVRQYWVWTAMSRVPPFRRIPDFHGTIRGAGVV